MKKGMILTCFLLGAWFPVYTFAGDTSQSNTPQSSQLRVEQEFVVLAWEMAAGDEHQTQQVLDKFYLGLLHIFTFQENLLYGKVEIKNMVRRMAPQHVVMLTKYIRFLDTRLDYYHKRGAVDPQQYRNIHGSLAYILESIEE